MKAKKTSLKSLDDVPRHKWSGAASLDTQERGLYTEKFEDQQYDFVFDPKPASKRLIVFFSGDARRTMYEPPVFQRWSWASKFPASCLYFSDPGLYQGSDLGLGWYSGSSQGDYLEHIATIVKSVAKTIGASEDCIFSYGSSGGGFAALRFASFYDGVRVIAINPQTDLWRYQAKWTSRMSAACYGAASLHETPESEHYKFTVLDPQVASGARSIFVAQNEQDADHYANHFLPFREFIESSAYGDKLATRVFADESGHAGAENEEIFGEILELIKS